MGERQELPFVVLGHHEQIHYMNNHDRDLLHIRMVGDYKTYSLNPTGRKDPKVGIIEEDGSLA